MRKSKDKPQNDRIGTVDDVDDMNISPFTSQAMASFNNAPPRLREIMQSLVSHLHGFAQDVSLSENEWASAIEFLTQVGKKTTDRRQEFILLSDVLGLSMKVVEINAPLDPKATESTVFGPFFVEGSPEIPLGGKLPGEALGAPLFVSGTVTDTERTPISGAQIEVWGSDGEGKYDVEYLTTGTAGRGHLFSDNKGFFSFWCVKPSYYPIPTDGPVGHLLKISNRPHMRPAHIHFKVSAQDYKSLVTHVFAEGDPYVTSDAVFGVRSSLIRRFDERLDPITIEGTLRDGPWYETTFDAMLARE